MGEKKKQIISEMEIRHNQKKYSEATKCLMKVKKNIWKLKKAKALK